MNSKPHGIEKGAKPTRNANNDEAADDGGSDNLPKGKGTERNDGTVEHEPLNRHGATDWRAGRDEQPDTNSGKGQRLIPAADTATTSTAERINGCAHKGCIRKSRQQKRAAKFRNTTQRHQEFEYNGHAGDWVLTRTVSESIEGGSHYAEN